MMWFKRSQPGIKPQIKKSVSDGIWIKCDQCNEIVYCKQLEEYAWICTQCNFHFRIDSHKYIQLFLDENSFQEMDAHLKSIDLLKFKDKKSYSDRLKEAKRKTGLTDAIRTGRATISGIPVVFCVMDFSFIGGSMGSVVGEKIARAVDVAGNQKLPLIIVSASGGARMMESILSLMQMAKTASRLAWFSENGGLFISILTNPTMAGVMASYAMLGDIHLAEPGALIGFAGPRVIKQTIGEELPEGFQRAKFQLDHGFVDAVVSRIDMREILIKILTFF
ncbi:acetyl-CoA carboxylase carboxyltransferase subunit beta [bacterium]|nr:acetyl-CoA carboxylase carboxyltransferase subunit beta [bacterium]